MPSSYTNINKSNNNNENHLNVFSTPSQNPTNTSISGMTTGSINRRQSTVSIARFQLKCDDMLEFYWTANGAVEANDQDELTDALFRMQRLNNGKLDKDLLGSLLFRSCELMDDDSYLRFRELDNKPILTMLLDLGANVNFQNDEQSTTCLMLAAKKGNDQLIDLLLKSRAKINITDRYGWTALFYACYFGQELSTRCLLDNGAQINVTDCDGMSCLIWAAGRGQCSLVELLISKGANVNIVDRYHTSALIWASRKGNTKIVEVMLKNGANINEQGMYGWTPLIVAVKNNHMDTINLLLSYKPNLSICDGERLTPLMLACIEANEELALELIKNGAPINQVDKQNMSPLIFAARAKNTKIMKALIEAGAIIELEGSDHRSAVHWSIIKNDAESYRLLLAKGANTMAKNTNGETHLMLAAKHHSEEIIKIILEYNEIGHHAFVTGGRNGGRDRISVRPTNACSFEPANRVRGDSSNGVSESELEKSTLSPINGLSPAIQAGSQTNSFNHITLNQLGVGSMMTKPST